MEYECDGKTNLVTVLENKILELPAKGETGPVRVIRAVYGQFNENLKGLPPIKSVDVTERLAGRIQDQMLTARADNDLAGGDPAFMVPKELRVDYTLDGVAQQVTVQENQELRLPEDAWTLMPPGPRVSLAQGNLVLTVAEPGIYTFSTATGRRRPWKSRRCPSRSRSPGRGLSCSPRDEAPLRKPRLNG